MKLFDLDTERAILSCIIYDNGIIPDVVEVVKPDDFHVESHKEIFAAMVELYFDKSPVDLITLSGRLPKNMQAISQIADGFNPTSMWLGYAKKVKDYSDCRKLSRIADNIQEGLKEGVGAGEMVGVAIQAIFDLSVGTNSKAWSMKEVVKASFSQIEAASEQKGVVGIHTGLLKLDDVLGGLKNKLYILAARPGIGKSALAKCISVAAGEGDKSVLVFSLEMPKEELGIRYLSGVAGIDGKSLEKGHLKDVEYPKLTDAASRLQKFNIHIDDNPRQTEIDIWSKSKRHKVKHGLDLLIVDYLQLVKCSTPTGSREQDVASISKAFKAMATDLSCSCLILAQLSRECEKAKRRPMLSDLRESGGVEQDADVVVFLHKPHKYDDSKPEDLVEALVEKHRGGPVGYCDLLWEPETTSFKNRGDWR